GGSQPRREPGAELRVYRDGAARAVVHQHHDAFGGSGAELALENALSQAEGALADRQHARADINRAGIEEFGAEIELEPDNDEISVGSAQVQLLVVEEADAPALAESGEDRVVDMALAVGVAIAEVVARPDRIGGARGKRQGGGAVVVHGGPQFCAAGRIASAITPASISRAISASE